MGLRFRRSLTLLPGVRLNLGLGGASVSFGVRGASVTVGRQGTFANVGLPGTGLSYRTRLSPAPGRPAPSALGRTPVPSTPSATPAQTKHPLPSLGDIALRMFDDGTCAITLSNGGRPEGRQLKDLWDAYGEVLGQALAAEVDRFNAGLMAISNVHLDTPPSDCVPLYTPREFDTEPPGVPAEPALPAPPVLLAPPELGMLALLSEAARRRHAKEVEQAHQAHSEALEQWQQRKQATLDAYAVVCRNHRTARAAWDAARVRHEAREQDKIDAFPARVRTDLATMHECLDDTLMTLQWPRETALAYDIDITKRTVMVDIDLPEVEHIPKRAARLSNDGRTVIMNELSDRAVRQAYARHVHGIAMRVGGVVFAALPSIRTCVVSGYSQRRDPGTGTERDDYLLSVRFERGGFSRIDFDGLDRVDPVCVAEGFALRRNMTKTGIFTPIQPFQPEEL